MADPRVEEASRQAACNRIDDFYDKLMGVTRRHLKAPSTAKFADLGDEGVRVKKLVDGVDGSCSYYILSYVDAENGFGAHIRTQFIGKVVMKDYAFWVENFALNE
jgi:hypothetical protein